MTRRSLRMSLAALGLAVALVAALWFRYRLTPQAEAAPQPQAADPTPVAPELSDYTRRVVAYLYSTQPVTREQLGDYLIARMGMERVNGLVNKVIIEKACADRGVTCTEAEIDAQLLSDLGGSQVNTREVLDRLLRQYRKTLYEWREDVLRPKILMTKYLRDQVRIGEDDLRKAFASVHGEKVQCQMILWPAGTEPTAEEYDRIRNNADEFDRAARKQKDARLAKSGGLTDPFGRFGSGNDELERVAFTLKPGEVSPVMDSAQGKAVIKLLRRLPADATKKFEEVRAAMEQEAIDLQVKALIPETLGKLVEAAAPRVVLTAATAQSPGKASKPIAWIHATTPVTREQLGEYLILRHGTAKLEFCLNSLIIRKTAVERVVSVTDAEMDAALEHDIRLVGSTEEGEKIDSEKSFVDYVLKPQSITLYEWREDVIRPRLLMAKMLEGTVKAEEEDLKKAFESYHGEKIECQLILWGRSPKDHEIAIKIYDRIRKSDEEFERQAKMQPSGRLAARAGRLAPFGRHTTGNEVLEREVFRLKEGELTPVIETPEGYAVARVLRRHAADTTVKLADVRAKLEKEVVERKTQIEIPASFHKLWVAAQPNMLLRPQVREEDLVRQVRKEIGEKK